VSRMGGDPLELARRPERTSIQIDVDLLVEFAPGVDSRPLMARFFAPRPPAAVLGRKVTGDGWQYCMRPTWLGSIGDRDRRVVCNLKRPKLPRSAARRL